MSFAISLFIVFTIFVLSFRETADEGPGHYDFKERFAYAYNAPVISVSGIFASLPLIIFAFMYQPNTPAIYTELKQRNLTNIKKVLFSGTLLASACYIMVGMFGYATFAMRPDIAMLMERNNILQNDFNGIYIIKLCLLGMLLVVFFATPFCVLPNKDSIEELITKEGEKLSHKQNLLYTFLLVALAFVIAIEVPTISDAMTVLGATTNSGIGFLLPIHFYLKTQKGKKELTTMKIMCYIIYVMICLSSVITMYSFIKGKMDKSTN